MSASQRGSMQVSSMQVGRLVTRLMTASGCIAVERFIWCAAHSRLPLNPSHSCFPNLLCAPTFLALQRFAQSSLFKRTVLEHIAADLLAMHFTPEPSVHGASGTYVCTAAVLRRYVCMHRCSAAPGRYSCPAVGLPGGELAFTAG